MTIVKEPDVVTAKEGTLKYAPAPPEFVALALVADWFPPPPAPTACMQMVPS
jgi:hypothetical protein